MLLIDISPAITPALAVWPGDTPPSREIFLDIARGDNITLSTLHATVHLGSHVDGANHYGLNAPSVDAAPLERFIGTCQVLQSPNTRGRRVTIDDIKEKIVHPRVLIRTDSFPDPNRWNDDFSALEPSLVDFLHGHGVELIGIDTPSVDTADSKDLPAHQRCLAHNISILEGLVLGDVRPGIYDLIALPLKLVGFDASPVRAVLRKIGQ